jgi:hypothetical protein
MAAVPEEKKNWSSLLEGSVLKDLNLFHLLF